MIAAIAPARGRTLMLATNAASQAAQAAVAEAAALLIDRVAAAE